MDTRRRLTAFILCAFLFTPAVFFLYSQSAEAVSAQDPIALKSYVDSMLNELETRLNAKIQGGVQPAADTPAPVQTDIAALTARITALTAKVDAVSGQSGSLFFTPVEVFADQRVFFGEGAEAVLRTGGALAIRGGMGPLVDLIDGKDLDAGEEIPLNHVILSPRDDNRGFRVTEDAWILIKGPYEIRG